MAAKRSYFSVPDRHSRDALARPGHDGNDARPDTAAMSDRWLAGLDGCRAGWVAAFVRPAGEEVRVRVVPCFADAAHAPEAPDTIAVDVPIGLPERIDPGGR